MPLIMEAIGSVMAQTYSNWELMVVDDGSTDDTVTAIRAIIDPRIRVIELHHTGHMGILRNTGVEKGFGEWIAFLDSDDTWLPKKLEIQVSALQTTGNRWCYGKI